MDVSLFTSAFDYDQNYQRPAKTMRRVEVSHEMDWVRACKGKPRKQRVETSSHLAMPVMNEMVVIGVVAVRLQDLKRELLLGWGANMRFTNISCYDDEIRVVKRQIRDYRWPPAFRHSVKPSMQREAAEREYLKHTYRNGWSI